MKNNRPADIQKIVDEALPSILSGESSLEQVLAAHPQQATSLRAHLESALWLTRQRAELEPRPGYLSAGRDNLVRQITRQPPQSAWQRLWRRPSPQRTAIHSLAYLLLAFSLFLVVNNLYLAARVSLPGDWLYPVKLSAEQIQLALTFDPQAEARLQIEITRQRSTEIVQMVLEEDIARLPATADRLEQQIARAVSQLERAGDADPIPAEELARSMQHLLANERFILSLLRGLEPAYAFAGLDQAIQAITNGLNTLQD